MRVFYGMVCAAIGALTNLAINLLSAALQQRAFADQFTTSAIGWLGGMTVVGLLVGVWLGAEIPLPAPPVAQAPPQKRKKGAANTVTMTRFRALLSYGKLRGQGIHLADILLVCAKLDIDTRE